MEFKFNEIQKELLEYEWQEKNLLTIKGVNGFGVPFETVGRITTTDQGNSGIKDTVIYIEFGKTKSREDRNQTNYFAPFALNARTDLIANDSQLIIKSIQTQDGFMLYENNKFKEIEEVCKKNVEAFLERSEFTNNEDAVTRALKQMIGKPIILNGTAAVLASVEGNTDQGNTILTVCSGVLVGKDFVNKDSVLFTENNDGSIYAIASNKLNYNCFDKKNGNTDPLVFTVNNDGSIDVIASNKRNYNCFDKKNENTENE